MKTIVVPVNFSASSDNAARYAADMAIAMGAALNLINVLQIPVSTAEIPMNDYVFEEMQQHGADGLKQLREELIKRTDGKLNISTDMETGSVEYRVEEFCVRKDPFVVIMGNAGNSLERVLAGNPLAGVIRHLPYPLIVVPENAVFHSIKKIVLACDLDDIVGGIPVSISFLKDFREIFNASFDVINISSARRDAKNEAEAAFEFNSWKDRLREICPEVHFVPMKKVEEGISEYLGSHPADLLLVFPKKHGFLEFHTSQAKKIVFHSQVPVMSIHASTP